jgi:transcriptional regulator with XRE-family HTH domain
LRERLGLALQRERQRHGLSQSQVAKLAKLSLKYIGEIERGEANLTMDALEQIATALQWNPFELSLRDTEALPDGVRTLVLTELFHMQQLVATAIGWLQRLDATLASRRQVEQTQVGQVGAGAGQAEPEETPLRRRGRPRKPKDEPPTSNEPQQ